MAKTARERKTALGLKRRDVWAHEDDWPKIRELEEKLQNKRFGKKKH